MIGPNGMGSKLMTDLTDIKTKDLVEELKKREGVDVYTIEPYREFKLETADDVLIRQTGPVIILVVSD